MQLIKVNCSSKDFIKLCKQLEDFQYNLLPELKQLGYSLTNDLENVTGFIIYLNKKPIGCIGFKPFSNDACEIVRVFVSEEFRGLGYAKIMFDKVENLIKFLGYKKSVMFVWAKSKSALKLYSKLGYKCSEMKISEKYNYEYYMFNKNLN